MMKINIDERVIGASESFAFLTKTSRHSLSNAWTIFSVSAAPRQPFISNRRRWGILCGALCKASDVRRIRRAPISNAVSPADSVSKTNWRHDEKSGGDSDWSNLAMFSSKSHRSIKGIDPMSEILQWLTHLLTKVRRPRKS